MTEDTDIWVRSAAVEVISDQGGAIDEIKVFLKSYDVPVRMAASSGLVKRGEEKYLADVLDPLTHPIPDRRYQAIGYLGKIGTEVVLPHLSKLFDHEEPEMVFYSLKAVEGKTTSDMLPKLKELIRDDFFSNNFLYLISTLYTEYIDSSSISPCGICRGGWSYPIVVFWRSNQNRIFIKN